MTEEAVQDANEASEQVAHEAAEELVAPQQTEETVESPAEPKQDSDAERNWKQLRDSKKALEREVQELRQQMESIASSKAEPPEEDEDLSLGDDDLVEGKHVKKLMKKLHNVVAQQQNSTLESRLKTKFPDFESVVTKGNVEKLKQAEPELFSAIVSGSDNYAKAVAAYKALKTMGYVESPDEAENKARIQQNVSKPVSTQAIKGQGALHEANAFARGLTPELKKQLQQEMADATRGY